MLATHPSNRWFTWSGREPPGKPFFQSDKVEEPITPLRIKFMMHDRSHLSGWQGRILEGYRLISIYKECRSGSWVIVWWVSKHETRSNSDSCVGFISLSILSMIIALHLSYHLWQWTPANNSSVNLISLKQYLSHNGAKAPASHFCTSCMKWKFN